MNSDLIATIVGIVVVVLLLASLIAFLGIYSRQKKINVSAGVEDKEITLDIEKSYKKLEKKNKATNYEEMVIKEDHRSKVGTIVLNIFYYLLSFIALVLLVVSLYFAFSGKMIKFQNKDYYIVNSSDMSSVNKKNTDMNDVANKGSIQKGALISIEKVDTSNLVPYQDILAYTNDDGDIVIHRLIQINKDGTLVTRGDAYTGPLSNETHLEPSKVIGKWDGKTNNVALGTTINVFKNPYMIIALGFVTVYFFGTALFGGSSSKNYASRRLILAKEEDKKLGLVKA